MAKIEGGSMDAVSPDSGHRSTDPTEFAPSLSGLPPILFLRSLRTIIDAVQVDRRNAIAELRHPAASHELPSFITSPGETDVLMVVMSLFLTLAVVMFGILFLRLHTLPERMAHKSQKIQFEIVAVLGLIALFTHMHIFWIAGLLLAMIDFPDFGTSLGRIATSTEKIAGIKSSDGATELQSETLAADIKHTGEAPGAQLGKRGGDGGVTDSDTSLARKKALRHA